MGGRADGNAAKQQEMTPPPPPSLPSPIHPIIYLPVVVGRMHVRARLRACRTNHRRAQTNDRVSGYTKKARGTQAGGRDGEIIRWLGARVVVVAWWW